MRERPFPCFIAATRIAHRLCPIASGIGRQLHAGLILHLVSAMRFGELIVGSAIPTWSAHRALRHLNPLPTCPKGSDDIHLQNPRNEFVETENVKALDDAGALQATFENPVADDQDAGGRGR
jgi:hypothetical protein